MSTNEIESSEDEKMKAILEKDFLQSPIVPSPSASVELSTPPEILGNEGSASLCSGSSSIIRRNPSVVNTSADNNRSASSSTTNDRIEGGKNESAKTGNILGIFRVMAHNCIPTAFYQRNYASKNNSCQLSKNGDRHHRDCNNSIGHVSSISNSDVSITNENSSSTVNGKRRMHVWPYLLFSLVLYGAVSIVIDIFHSIQSLRSNSKLSSKIKPASNSMAINSDQKSQKQLLMRQHEIDQRQKQRSEVMTRFPGGFLSLDNGATAVHQSRNTYIKGISTGIIGNDAQSTFSSHLFDDGDAMQDVGNGKDNDKRLASTLNFQATMMDVSKITEYILSTTFKHALEYSSVFSYSPKESQSDRQPNEILFFWSIGGTLNRGPMGKLPKKLLHCFPNVVQAGGGYVNDYHKELQLHGHELRILQKKVFLDGANPTHSTPSEKREGATLDRRLTRNIPKKKSMEGKINETKENLRPTQQRKMSSKIVRDDGKYVNVDMFSPEGIRRAADLKMLFPSHPYPVMNEHDYKADKVSKVKINAEETTSDVPDPLTLASSQIQFITSPFLPEVALGLFEPPPTVPISSLPLQPKARVHGLLPPSSLRIHTYYSYYVSTFHSSPPGSNGSLLQFVTSSSIVVNNYVTRILSNQLEEGSEVNEFHLEVAKNVVLRKIRLWPIRGMKDMVQHWVEWYGWNEGVADIIHDLEKKYGSDVMMNDDINLGMECMFPDLPLSSGGGGGDDDQDGRLTAKVDSNTNGGGKAKNELQVEIEKIIRERNFLDEILFQFVVELHKSWISNV